MNKIIFINADSNDFELGGGLVEVGSDMDLGGGLVEVDSDMDLGGGLVELRRA